MLYNVYFTNHFIYVEPSPRFYMFSCIVFTCLVSCIVMLNLPILQPEFMFHRKGHRRAASLGNNLDNVVVVPANNAPGLRDTSANNTPGLRDTSANNAPGLRDTKSHNNASSLRSTNNKSQRSRDNNSPELRDDALRDGLSPTPLVRGVSPTQRGPSPVQRGGKVRNYSSLPVSSPTPDKWVL